MSSSAAPGLYWLSRFCCCCFSNPVNGKPAKASYTVKLGDIIEVTFGNRPVKIRVLSDVEQKGKDVAREMFEIIEE